jgi:hypothetical protein
MHAATAPAAEEEDDMRIKSTHLAVAVVALLPSVAQAGVLMCTLSTLRACDEIVGCTRVLQEEVNVPRFWKVDLDNKTISGTRPDGSEGSTAIQTMQARLLKVNIGGIEHGRAWSATIGDDGSLNIVASAEGYAFVGFGACTNM